MTHPIVDWFAIGKSRSSIARDREGIVEVAGDRAENRRPADRRDAVPGNSGGF
ncbi:hypothetical protein LB523_22745 [Mesorhizobium sp. ESP-6-4]|uniref:hypothetical protein n=1 Tax=unclassified Mesorhizobium TaxID=325217 RepID=UPI00159709D3|nr:MULTISPECIES: hypothetical protein [unclassified Mesorhizobium]MBZ9661871.1 hypothetical protein [Mesorhizobium sp. ESP-6-4]MBZ9842305.1 hypothetical protein [Mesorhizobium sp. CA5]